MVNAAGEKTRAVERRADRRWLDKPHSAAFAADGSFAIIAIPSSWGSGRAPSLTLFNPGGDPTRTLELPGMTYPRVAFNGAIACVVSEETILFVSAAEGRTGISAMSGGKKRWWWYPYSSPDGRELWMLDPEAKALHRFVMPEL